LLTQSLSPTSFDVCKSLTGAERTPKGEWKKKKEKKERPAERSIEIRWKTKCQADAALASPD